MPSVLACLGFVFQHCCVTAHTKAQVSSDRDTTLLVSLHAGKVWTRNGEAMPHRTERIRDMAMTRVHRRCAFASLVQFSDMVPRWLRRHGRASPLS